MPTPTNVVTAVFPHAVRRRKKTSVFRSKIVLRDGSTVLTLQYIRRQDWTIGIAALDCPVDNSVLLGWALSPSGNPPGGDAVVLVEKAPPICTALLIAEHRLPLRFEEEPPHEAVLAERVGHVELTIRLSRHRPLQAEPAHVVGSESARHTDFSLAALPMAVELATLR